MEASNTLPLNISVSPPMFSVDNSSEKREYQDMVGDNTSFIPLNDSIWRGGQHFSNVDTAVYYINLTIIPVIAVIGFTSNLLCMLAFTCTRLKVQSSGIYLVFLATVDSAFLLCLLLTWFQMVGVNLTGHPGICQFIFFCKKVLSFLSVWALVLFTLERYFIVYHPLRRHILCTPKRTRIALTVLFIIAVLLNVCYFKIYGIRRVAHGYGCFIQQPYRFAYRILAIIEAIIWLLIPSLIITFLNCAIGYKVRKFVFTNKTSSSSSRVHKCCDTFKLKNVLLSNSNIQPKDIPQHKRLSHTPLVVSMKISSGTSEENLTAINNTHLYSKQKLPKHLKHDFHLRTTRALLVVSVAFLALHLPIYSVNMYAMIRYLIDEYHQYPRTLVRLRQFLQFLYYISFSTNCLIYGACNRSCRFALLRLFRGWFSSQKFKIPIRNVHGNTI